MFDFIHDSVAWMYLVGFIITVLAGRTLFRLAEKIDVEKYPDRRAYLRVGIPACSGIVVILIVSLFIIRAYAVYEVTVAGGVRPDSEFINPSYSEQKNGHFYSLYVYSSSNMRLGDQTGDGMEVNGLYRAYQKERAVEDFKNGKLPFTNKKVLRDGFASHSYAEMTDISFGKKQTATATEASKKEGFELFKKSKSNAQIVAEKHLGMTLPDNLFDRVADNSYGDSAGLMMALELLHQFGEKDLLKGYKICGTGTIAVNGDVGTIGGLRMKLISAVAADKEQSLHFHYCFVSQKDYREALQIVMEENLDLTIKAVKNIDEAIAFLDSLESKPWLQN